MNASTWKWVLAAPLAPAWRKRLELCFGVVVSSAAVVALSSTIRPDPQKLAARHATPAITLPPQAIVEPTDPTNPQLRQAMMSAARAGDVFALRKACHVPLLLEGTLRLAAQSGHKDAVVWLLGCGADVHEQEETTRAPVLAADAFPEIAALLEAWGAVEPTLVSASIVAAPNAFARALAAHPERAKHSGALVAAAHAPWKTPAEKRSIMTRLLDAGADPNDTFDGATALGNVVMEGKDDCMAFVDLLLDRGARVTGEVLGAALSLDDARRPQVLDALLERPIANGVTAAALARATHATSEDVDRIVKLGIDWTWHDGEEDAALPLLSAVRRGDRDYARTLLAAGAPVDVHFKEATTALAEAIDGSPGDDAHARIVELLVERGANVNRRFPDGRTPLFAAAESGNIRVVNFLVAHGARVNEGVLHDTALDAAEQHGNIPAARVLAAHGGLSANVRNTCRGQGSLPRFREHLFARGLCADLGRVFHDVLGVVLVVAGTTRLRRIERALNVGHEIFERGPIGDDAIHQRFVGVVLELARDLRILAHHALRIRADLFGQDLKHLMTCRHRHMVPKSRATLRFDGKANERREEPESFHEVKAALGNALGKPKRERGGVACYPAPDAPSSRGSGCARPRRPWISGARRRVPEARARGRGRTALGLDGTRHVGVVAVPARAQGARHARPRSGPARRKHQVHGLRDQARSRA